MTASPHFRMNTEGEDLEDLAQRLRVIARRYERAAGPKALTSELIRLLRESQASEARAGVNRR